MSIKVLFTYDYGIEQMNMLKALGYDVMVKPEKGLIYTEELKEVEVLVCYDPFQTLDISKMDKLKWIQLSSIGIDQLPADLTKKRDIIVSNNRGGYSIPMGEWIILKILELYKNSRSFYAKQSERKWKLDTSVMELYGKTIGFIGTGTIANEAAKRLQGFGVRILGLNSRGTETKYFDCCYPREQIDEMLSQSDVVVVAIPSTKETWHLINEERFAAMKQGAVLINIARGCIIDEASLISNLESGKLIGAALDVFENEPLSEDNPLWSYENVLITPHNSWISEKRNERRFDFIIQNMTRYAEAKNLENVVDLDKGY